MEHRQQSMYLALGRAKGYWAAYGNELGPAATAPALTRLDEAMAVIGGAGAMQYGAKSESESGTLALEVLRRTLRTEEMQPIASIVRARLFDLPTEKMRKFEVPPADVSDVTLILAARSMADAATEYYSVIRGEGLDDEFIDRLRAAATELERAVFARDGARGRRRGAGVSLVVQSRLGREVLRVLSAFVIRGFAHRPDRIAEWFTAIRIKRKPAASAASAAAGGEAPKQDAA